MLPLAPRVIEVAAAARPSVGFRSFLAASFHAGVRGGLAIFAFAFLAVSAFAVPGTPPNITSSNTITFTAGIPGTFTATATGSPAPQFSLIGTVPPFLSISPNGVLHYDEEAAYGGNFAFTLRATNGVNPADSQTLKVTVLKQEQFLTLSGIGNTYYGQPPIFLHYSSSSGLPVTVTSRTQNICSLTFDPPDTILTIHGVGRCIVIAQQLGNGRYLPAENAIISFAVLPVVNFLDETRTGAGTGGAHLDGMPTCTFTKTSWILPPVAMNPPIDGVPATMPPGLYFPFGLFDLATDFCGNRPMSLTLSFRQNLPANAEVWRFGRTTNGPAPHWYRPIASIVGNTITFSLRDGGPRANAVNDETPIGVAFPIARRRGSN